MPKLYTESWHYKTNAHLLNHTHMSSCILFKLGNNFKYAKCDLHRQQCNMHSPWVLMFDKFSVFNLIDFLIQINSALFTSVSFNSKCPSALQFHTSVFVFNPVIVYKTFIFQGFCKSYFLHVRQHYILIRSPATTL